MGRSGGTGVGQWSGPGGWSRGGGGRSVVRSRGDGGR